MSELRELLHAQANAVTGKYRKLRARMMALEAENSQRLRVSLRLWQAIKAHHDDHQGVGGTTDERLWLHLRPEVKPLPEKDEVEILRAEVQKLRGAIEAHRRTTALRLGGASPWATDIELWEALDA